MTSRRRAPTAKVDDPFVRRRLVLPAALIWPLALAACGGHTTVLRTDGWEYAGPIESADRDTVTLSGPTGPLVIPRREVVDYDLPGDGWAVIGGASTLVGLGELIDVLGRSRPQGFGAYVSPGLYLTIGAALGGWGLWQWLGAREAWTAGGGEVGWNPVTWTGDGVLVRF